MKLFYDLRLGYLVAAPGQETPLASLQAKAGDGEEVILQFGRSSDPTASSVIVAAATWTAENLAGGTLITIGIKEDGEYSDGTILASSSTFTHSSGAFTYTFALDLNTTEINTALERGDANAADDIAELDCGFEVTFQVGGAGGWRSSVLPVSFTLYHDLIYGDEGTPVNAGDPDQYLLKSAAVEYLPTTSSLTGGTSADLDYIPTSTQTLGKMVQFIDTDATPDVIRNYKLEASTDPTSAPDFIRGTDYNASTNARGWRLYQISGASDPYDKIDVQTFTSNGTWTKPSGSTTHGYAILIGGGGGGGGGACRATTAFGGGGGGGAGVVRFDFAASHMGSTEAVVVGAAGAGGDGLTAPGSDTNGNAGTAGGDSTFGGFKAVGGTAGSGGTGAAGTAGAATANSCGSWPVFASSSNAGGAGNSTTGTAAGSASTIYAPTGGGGGGGVAAATSYAGGAGGAINLTTSSASVAGGTAGAAEASGNAGNSADGFSGTGGGGGGAIVSGTGGDGGNGANYGAGGGGGGACADTGGSSGAGGAGGAGIVYVVTFLNT